MGNGAFRGCASIMKKLTIGIKAEGHSDFLLLEQLINRLLEGEHDYVRLHPETKFGVRV